MNRNHERNTPGISEGERLFNEFAASENVRAGRVKSLDRLFTEEEAREARNDPGSIAGDGGFSADDIDGNSFDEDKRADMVPSRVSHPDTAKLSRLDHYVLAFIASGRASVVDEQTVRDAQILIAVVDHASR